MCIIFSIIDMMICYVIKKHCFLRLHMYIQIMGIVCDLIMVIFGNGLLRFVLLITDIIIQIGGAILCKRMLPDTFDCLSKGIEDKDHVIF